VGKRQHGSKLKGKWVEGQSGTEKAPFSQRDFHVHNFMILNYQILLPSSNQTIWWLLNDPRALAAPALKMNWW
jgi:hypothetical protein